MENSENVTTEQKITQTERELRILLGVLLILSCLPLIGLMFFVGAIVSIPFLIVALYLLLSRRHHLIFEILLFLIGIFIYFKSGGFFSLYKSTTLSMCPGINPNNLYMIALMFGAPQYFLTIATVFLLATNISNRFEGKKGLRNGLIFLVIAIFFLLLPFLYQPKVRFGEAPRGNTAGEGPHHFAFTNASTRMSWENENYVYTARLKNTDAKPVAITDICIDGKMLDLSNNNMLFLENAKLIDKKIVIEGGQEGIIKLKSSKPFYSVTLFENQAFYNNIFLR